MNERLNIAMIMDGNRRWAKKAGKSALLGHEAGANTLQKVLEWCKKKNIYSLTLYTFSTENFKRPKDEVEGLFSLARQYFLRFKKEKMTEDVRITFLGDLSLFPTDIQDICKELEEKTKHNKTYLLQFCFGYGGRQEIIHATKELIKDVQNNVVSIKDITESTFSKYLYTSIEPDIVIRTGGASRQSNFLPWQSTYSEWFYIDTFWPDITSSILDGILDTYTKRERRFGV